MDMTIQEEIEQLVLRCIAAGGMFIGTFVGIFLVPGLYLIFESWSAHLNRNKVSYDEEDEK